MLSIWIYRRKMRILELDIPGTLSSTLSFSLIGRIPRPRSLNRRWNNLDSYSCSWLSLCRISSHLECKNCVCSWRVNSKEESKVRPLEETNSKINDMGLQMGCVSVEYKLFFNTLINLSENVSKFNESHNL